MVAVSVGTAVAGPFENAAAALERGDYATAKRIWQPLAEQGNAAAQYSLGNMYDSGRGTPQNYAEALKWYHKAAEQGYAKAQNNLG
jgi:TPR repeat protein